MRILFACTGVIGHGGIQRFNRNLIRSWVELGIAVDVISLNDGVASEIEELKIDLVKVYGANRKKVSWVGKVGALLQSQRYAYCVCGHINLAPILVPLMVAAGIRLDRRALILHGIEVWERIRGIKRLSARHFGIILPVSAYTGESFISQVGEFVRRRVTIFPNTISQEVAEVRPRQVAQEQGLSVRLLSVSRLSNTERDKGITHVLDALHALKERVALRYTIVGDGNDRPFLESYAKEFGLENCVEFKGALSDADLWEVYQTSDIFVLPSRKEGFGIVFLEAMYFGLPVIAAGEKGALDVVRDQVNGFLVQFGSVESIGEKLLELSADEKLRKTMGQAGRTLVVPGGEFSFEAFRNRAQAVFSLS